MNNEIKTTDIAEERLSDESYIVTHQQFGNIDRRIFHDKNGKILYWYEYISTGDDMDDEIQYGPFYPEKCYFESYEDYKKY